MDFLLAAGISGLAAFIWLFLFRIIDHFQSKTWREMIFFFVLGAVSVTVPHFAPNMLSTVQMIMYPVLYQFIDVAFIEECGKLLFLIIGMLFLPRSFLEATSYLIFGATIGIGFAFVENIGYALENGSLVLHFRDVISMSLHAFCSGIVGYGVYKLRTGKPSSMAIWLLCGICIHAGYNSGLTLGDDFPFLIMLSYSIYFISIELFGLLLNNAINQSSQFDDAMPFQSRAIRKSMTLGFVILFVLFFFMYIVEYGGEGAGTFLFWTAPLVFVVYVAVNRLTSLVFVRGKLFPVIPSFPFRYGGIDFGVLGIARARLTMKGLPYEELPFVSRINLETTIRPINANFNYFGNKAVIRVIGKVYAKSQILFYPLEFIQSEEFVDRSKFYYLMPKFSGENERGNNLIVALIARDEKIDSESEDPGKGGFCAWIYLEKPKELPMKDHFIDLIKK